MITVNFQETALLCGMCSEDTAVEVVGLETVPWVVDKQAVVEAEALVCEEVVGNKREDIALVDTLASEGVAAVEVAVDEVDSRALAIDFESQDYWTH